MSGYGYPDDAIKRGDYRDTGCQHAPACLTCHLPRCYWDDPIHVLREKREQLAAQVWRWRTDAGLSVGQIASALKMSTRTIFRILQAGKPATAASSDTGGGSMPQPCDHYPDPDDIGPEICEACANE